MADVRIVLWESSAASLALLGTLADGADTVEVSGLAVGSAELALAGGAFGIPLAKLQPAPPATEFTFAAGAAVSETLQLVKKTGAAFGWLDTNVQATLQLNVPPANGAFVVLAASGGTNRNLGPLLLSGDLITFRLAVADQADGAKGVAPTLDIGMAGWRLPTIKTLGWAFPDPDLFELPALSVLPVGDTLPIEISWDKLRITFGAETTVAVTRLRASTRLVPGLGVEGDLTLVFGAGGLNKAKSSFVRRDITGLPDFTLADPTPTSTLGLSDIHRDETSFALRWQENNLNYWLGRLLPNLGDGGPGSSTATLRVLWSSPVKEIRLDWEVAIGARSLTLPGVQVTPPASTTYSVVLSRSNGAGTLDLLTLALNIPAGNLVASSTFAWERDGERELQNDDERTNPDPLFKLTASHAGATSLMLMQIERGSGKAPRFLRQLTMPIAPIIFPPNPDPDDAMHTAVALETTGLDSDWTLDFDLNLSAAEQFNFPFLKDKGDATSEQFISIGKPDKELKLGEGVFSLVFPVSVKIGALDLTSKIGLGFNWETFALKVSHDAGIAFYGDDETALDGTEYLGLNWRFKGVKGDGTAVPANKFHYFTLATDRYNYALQQATGAVFEIEYTKASKEPIVFAIHDFALTPKGINLTADVTDRPARLNGLETRFRFGGSSIQIKENRIADFTLAGSGPLPPDLVGDATADIALQFKQVDGNLTLIAGGAKLKGSKLLDCKSTRFQFQVDAIGLKFVYEGAFHLYFTISGSAQFKLAPSDDTNGALALLGKIKIDLVDCPLTGDARVIAKHVKFLIELPKPKKFSFLGCFEMELRAIGFIPQAEVFDNDAAMQITGKVNFVQGPGDTPDSKVDYHIMFIGLPGPGEIFPRIHFERLPVNINFGAAFKLNGVVNFVRKDTMQGFEGEGSLEIQGLPSFAAAFAFMRVRRDDASPWLRAWFIYLEVRKVSFRIPVVELYIREVGLGFGYRYTLVSIKAADQANDVRKLLKELKALSATQGDLSKVDRWAVDLEEPGRDPRWTIVLRAMISQGSASPTPLRYEEAAEQNFSNVFLFDAIIAFRSDFTFLMSVRLWLNTNYNDFLTDRNGAKASALLLGFVLLSPRQKRLLANVSTNPGGKVGDHPPLPDFMKTAIESAQFTMTLLVEPGLVHYELGWPNMLRWNADLGPLKAEFEGGFIFRVSSTELVTGVSFLARAKLDVQGEIDLGLVGVRVSAHADVAFGARYIGLLVFQDPITKSAQYGAIGLEANIQFSISFWIKIPLVFTSITLHFDFSLSIGFTAGLEIGIAGLHPINTGLRGTGTLSVSCCGHSLEVSVKLGIREDLVETALARTKPFLNVGLEATDVEAVPGVPDSGDTLGAGDMFAVRALPRAPLLLDEAEADAPFSAPEYSMFVVRPAPGDTTADGWTYFVLLPRAERSQADGELLHETGFLPTPPRDTLVGGIEDDATFKDFEITIPAANEGELFEIEQFDPRAADGATPWTPRASGTTFDWKARWSQPILQGEQYAVDDANRTVSNTATKTEITLRDYLVHAYLTGTGTPSDDPKQQKMNATGDPSGMPGSRVIEDARVQNPSDSAFEAAVRGAYEQFRGSPFFKFDPNAEYDQNLSEAFRTDTTIYSDDGTVPQEPGAAETVQKNQQARQLRGMVVHDLVANLRQYARAVDKSSVETGTMIGFQMGLVFRAKGETLPAWLNQVATALGDVQSPTLKQRLGQDSTTPNGEARTVQPFNIPETDFSANPPLFQKVRHYTDAGTIAITWDLVWDAGRVKHLKGAQADPDHHLMHYIVRRRALDGNEREIVTTVKPTQALHRTSETTAGGEQSVLKRLKPRFQVVDHFAETREQQAGLTDEGRSYLYTITPVDFAGNAGRSLSLVATRFPNQPPQVPTNAELHVSYRLAKADFVPENIHASASNRASILPADLDSPAAPQLIAPRRVRIEWTEPAAVRSAARIAVKEYVLVFRKSATVPIGSYGLDSAIQGPRTKSLPTSNARPLPTDARIVIDSGNLVTRRTADGGQAIQTYDIPLVDLRDANVLPQAGEPWRPESWRVFVQAVGQNNVPSALTAVQLLLRVETEAGIDDEELVPRREERRPAELEWLPRPQVLPLLPPEDQRAQTGLAHFPMPQVDAATGKPPTFAEMMDGVEGAESSLKRITFLEHPQAIRMIRFRWNQAPSGKPAYPIDLNGGFQLLQLDADAVTSATFADDKELARALRHIQEIQMLPAEDLLLAPADTLTPNQWEAWYPSAMQRRHLWEARPASERPQNAETTQTPWHTWRESYLEWPDWPGVTSPSTLFGVDALHPVLQALVDALDQRYAVDVRVRPPLQPNDFAAFRQATAAKNDPYGWGLLQRLGLSVTLSLRQDVITAIKAGQEQSGPDRSGELITGNTLLLAVQDAIGRINNPLAQRLLAKLRELLQIYRGFVFSFFLFFGEEMRQAFVAYQANFEAQIAAVQGGKSLDQIDGTTLLAAIDTAIGPTDATQWWRDILRATFDEIKPLTGLVPRYMHGELLLQPRYSTRLPEEKGALTGDTLLGMLQLSLRPVVVQRLEYGKLTIRGSAGTTVDLLLNNIPNGKTISLIDQNDPAAGQSEVLGETGRPASRPITLPPHGETTVMLRGADLSAITIGIGLKKALNGALPASWAFAAVDAGPPLQLRLNGPIPALDKTARDAMRAVLAAEDKALADLTVELITGFPVTDERSTYFATPPPDLFAKDFADGGSDFGKQWLRLKAYLEALNSREANVPKIVVPTAPDEIAKPLPDVLGWLQRFFDACGGMSQENRAKAATGPWLATAYPRAGSPAYASPDASGRLQYDQLLEDKWAHNYRFYIQPYGRYDMLWRSFRQSPALFPVDVEEPLGSPDLLPDPNAGGLDVVLDRTQPVDRPLILGSRRLDAPALDGAQAPPGQTWEVIVAQHPEQALIERNQTLVRQLTFRHVAFTLLRRFTFAGWMSDLLDASRNRDDDDPDFVFDVEQVEDVTPSLPASYPERPDHVRGQIIENGVVVDDEELPLFRLKDAQLDEADARSLDLPERLGAFGQGALVLQWQALPFYYEHRLLVMAHTASTVSPVNEVIGRDFEYRSPTPEAHQSGAFVFSWQPPERFRTGGAEDDTVTLRARELALPLKRLWDALPPEAQAQWAAESPEPVNLNGTTRRPSSLPDPDVVYQVVEFFGGNVEVQAEFFFDKTAKAYKRRQLGQRILATEPEVFRPKPDEQQGDFILTASLVRTVELNLKGEYNPAALKQVLGAPEGGNSLRARVAINRSQLVVLGDLSEAQSQKLATALGQALLADPPGTQEDQTAVAALGATGYVQEPISDMPMQNDLPAFFAIGTTQLFGADDCTLVWEGPISAQEQAALAALPGDEGFRAAIQRLLTALAVPNRPAIVRETAPRGPDQPPPSIQSRVAFTTNADGSQYATLGWTGVLEDADKDELRRWATFAAFGDAIEALISAAAEAGGDAVSVPFVAPVRPTLATLPEVLKTRLMLGRAWLRFHGIMTGKGLVFTFSQEGEKLQALFAEAVDKQAVFRLYRATLANGLSGRTIAVRARRGSASVSTPVTLTIIKL